MNHLVKQTVRRNFIKVFLLCSMLCLLCSVNLFAGNPVSVKSGSGSVLKQSSKALLEIDYSATKVGDQTLEEYLQGRGEDFVRDWPQDKETAASYFKKYFNKKNKGMKLTTDVAEASHKIVIHVNKLDMGNAGGVFYSSVFAPKAGGCSMIGTIDVIDMSSNETACVLYVDEVQGVSVLSETLRLGLMYNELAVRICKLK